jgi:hypothetical protein
MKLLTATLALLVTWGGAGAQTLSDQDIAAAIAQGQAGKTLEKTCKASGVNGFDVTIEGPTGRIMRAAKEAKRRHRAFTPADVSSDIAGPYVTVIARRDQTLSAVNSAPQIPGAPIGVVANPYADLASFKNATDLVLRSRGSSAPVVLKPVRPITYSREPDGNYFVWTDGPQYVGPSPGADMIAWFDLAAFQAIPTRDAEAVIFVTDAGERRCKISDKERQAIR